MRAYALRPVVPLGVTLLVLAFVILSVPAVRAEEAAPFRLLESHCAVMLLIDPETGRIEDANRAALAFYGYSRDRLIGMNVGELNMLDPKDVEAERQRAASEKRNYFLFPHRLADGSVRTVEVYSSPVTNPETGRRYLLSIIHDASDKMLSEAERVEYERRLNLLVAKRAAELARTRVMLTMVAAATMVILVAGALFALAAVRQRRDARVLREALDERLRLYKELRHRVKNSFAITSSIVSIEASRTTEPAVAAALSTLSDRIDTLAALYEEMHLHEAENEIDAGEYLGRIAAGLRSGFGLPAEALSVEADRVPLDPRRASTLGLAANELLTNAIKHGLKAGGGSIRLSLKEEDGRVALRIWNDRPELPREFDPQRGAGFGLRLCVELAKELGGGLAWS